MNNWQEWRKQQRHKLIAERITINEQTHQQWSQAITSHIQKSFPILHQKKIGIYWPIRNEYDPRPLIQHFKQYGSTVALPVIINRHEPLEFHEWWQDAPVIKGAHGIPVPYNQKSLVPDALIIPMVGFDQHGYRLGYGSGYFDHTLAAQNPQPITIGIAFEVQRLVDIHPQSHDIAMSFVVTEKYIYQRIADQLMPIDIAN